MKKIILIILFILFIQNLFAQNFSEICFNSERYGDFSQWVDFDGDGDLDAFVSGENIVNETADAVLSPILYENKGNNNFLENSMNFPNLTFGASDWADYDLDGDMDLFLAGVKNTVTYESFIKIYENNGNGVFNTYDFNFFNQDKINVSFVKWGDIDNDGDLDIYLSGLFFDGFIPYAKIFRNNGNKTFTDIQAYIPQSYLSQVDFGDYDLDGDLDLGFNGIGAGTKIFKNSGNGIFIDSGIDFLIPEISQGDIEWGDYDQDGDLDLLLIGVDFYQKPDGSYVREDYSFIFRNDKNNVFTNINANIKQVGKGTATFADYDNDNDLDILLAGAIFKENRPYTQIYKNIGNDTFVGQNMSLPLWVKKARWGDYNGDSKPDILFVGGSEGISYAKIYLNGMLTSCPDLELGEDVNICASEFKINVNNCYDFYRWQDGSNDSVYIVKNSGLYTVEVSTKCKTYIDSKKVKLAKSLPNLNLGNDIFVCSRNTNKVFLNASEGFDKYLWQDGSTNSTFTVTQSGIYWVAVTNACGTVKDTINVTFKDFEDLDIPNVFTPNNDGKNDVFETNKYLIGSKLRIYNRWGNLVYQSENYQNNWKGENLPSGIYYYTLENQCLSNSKKGTISLLR